MESKKTAKVEKPVVADPNERKQYVIPAPGVRIKNRTYIGKQWLTKTEYSEIMSMITRRVSHDREEILGRRGGTQELLPIGV